MTETTPNNLPLKKTHPRQNEKDLMDWAVVSLKRVVDDRHCEMERPWDWISRDPDLRCLNRSPVFRELLRKQKQNDYPRANPGPDHTGTELAAAPLRQQLRRSEYQAS